MALAKHLMGAGFSAGQASAIGGIYTAFTASGSSQSDAQSIGASRAFVSGGDGSKGVILTGQQGDSIIIYNDSSSNLLVYPPSGSAINDGSANAAYTHPSYQAITYTFFSDNFWIVGGAGGDALIVSGTPTDGQLVTWDGGTSDAIWADPAFNPTFSTLTDGDVITYDSGTSSWINEQPAGGGFSPTITSVAADEILRYDAGTTAWVNEPAYAQEAIAFTTSGGTFVSPVVKLVNPESFQIDGSVIRYSGLSASTVDFLSLGSIQSLEFTNLEGFATNGGWSGVPTTVTTLTFTGLKYSSGQGSAITSVITLNYPDLVIFFGNFSLNGWTALTTVDLSSLQYLKGNISSTSGTASLANLDISSLKKLTGTVNFTSCAFSSAQVNGILAALVAMDGTNGTTLFANNVTITGTSGAPTGQGVTDAATLTGRGSTVTTN